MNDVMHRKRAEDFGRFEKVSLLSWELDTEREGSTFGAHRGQTNLRATDTARDVEWGRWKSQNRKNVYLSPYVKKPFNSKVIKGFVPELRSVSRFLCSMFCIYFMNILCTFRISVSGYATRRLDGTQCLHSVDECKSSLFGQCCCVRVY